MNAQTKILLALEDLNRRLARIEDAMATDTDKLVGINKASEISGITKWALRGRANRGLIQCTKDKTGHLLFRIKDLKEITK